MTMEKYGERYLVTKKLALTLLVFALAACVAVGLVVYYVGVEGDTDSQHEPSAEPEPGEPKPKPSKESEPATTKTKVSDVRLPTHLVPLKYKLELVPFIIPDNFTIRGYAEVRDRSSMKCKIRIFRLRWNVRSQLSMLLFMRLTLQ